MLPRWHLLFGGILAVIIWIAAPQINLIYVVLFFLASFLIDFDHYMCAVFHTKNFNLPNAYEYHKKIDAEDRERKKKGIREKGDFHLFHTVEFHILVGILGLYWTAFFYIFLGMMFHSLTDIYSMIYSDQMYRREFSFVAWLFRKITKS